jgi:uncharacterized protein YqcC (DUF446 family)
MRASEDTERVAALSAVVDALEAALRRAGLWERESPQAALLASPEPFCYDTLAFHQWLQWQLIPRMRGILAGGGALPSRSAIHPYAEDCLAAVEADASELLALIEHFDALIQGVEAAAKD